MRRTGVLACTSQLAAPLGPPDQQPWNLPTAYPNDNPHVENLNAFAKDVADATGGKLQITVHRGASLFKGPEIKRAVPTGQAQAGEILISILENEDPIFGIDVVPFLATSFDEAKKLWHASRPAIEQKLAAQGIMVLFAVPWGPQGIYAKKEINTIDDLKGAEVARLQCRHRADRRVGRRAGGDRAGGGAAAGAGDRRGQRVHVVGGDRLRLQGVGDADPLLRHAGLDSEQRHSSSTRRRSMRSTSRPRTRCSRWPTPAEERGWKVWEDKNEWYHEEIAKKG